MSCPYAYLYALPTGKATVGRPSKVKTPDAACPYEHRDHACDHDAECVICKRKIRPETRDHCHGRCRKCFGVKEQAEFTRIKMSIPVGFQLQRSHQGGDD